MSPVRQKLETLEAIFKESDAPILKHFNLGLSISEILNFFSENSIPPHSDLLDLYQWHNGLKSIYGLNAALTEIVPDGSFPNLNEMLVLRNDFLRRDYIDVENKNNYVPFLSGGEDTICMLRVSTGQVYYSSPAIQVFCDLHFVSLCSMLDFVIESYTKRLLWQDPNEGLQIDDNYWKQKVDY